MHWLTIIGIVLIAIGTFLTYIGQGRSAKSDLSSLQNNINEKNTKIEELITSNRELNVKVGEYQKAVTEKDKMIKELQAEVDTLNVTAPTLLPDGRIAASPYVFMASEFSDGIHRAKDLFDKGEYDEAYRIAEGLKQKNPNFALAYFLLGTIDIQRGDIEKGTQLLKRSLQLELPQGDKAWAFHNLGIVALRNQDIKSAIQYLRQAIQVNPDMEESKRTLKSIEEQLGRK
jgi:tetratricopeptide (TPR) repeat protein